ncbi:MFS transporter [Priestia megaterium]|uniref:MFS transporter n=1 Tax=Priestia megaterium TaxID=1404 RepID=UPI0018CDF76E|nr:MFS transporter [Priestia megaterium]MBG9472139.1 MFS transporter [Priestia megaterium]MDD9793543.1 MFS transporter [Priestia megaterium]MDF2053554.1 MFS transporter [Priestia megaterium]MDF2062956.1 MFS transporter [Priestia megaterium]
MTMTAKDTNTSTQQPIWLQEYIDSPERQAKLYKKTLRILMFSQIFGGAGLGAGVTVGALLAQDMLGTENAAGIPTALFTLGSAGAALLIGRSSQRFGRRAGLAGGFLAGGIGAIGVIIAALTNNIALLFLSLLIYGAGTASNLQARYAGTDLATDKQRATAASMAMVSTTLGAVVAPNLVNTMGEFADSIGVPTLAGPFILSGAAFIIAGLLILFFLRPDPLIVSTAIASAQKNVNTTEAEINLKSANINKKGVVVGAVIMILTQFVMAAIMTMTPIHMGHHGHGLQEVGVVIGFHIAAMYLPSPLTGILVDKLGRTTMAIASGVTLLASGLVAAFAPVGSMPLLILALVLLGLGWNFGLISGTALIIDSTHPSVRAKTQGSVDVLFALSGAAGGGLSGMVVAHSSYAALSLSGAILSLVLIPVVVWSRKTQS